MTEGQARRGWDLDLRDGVEREAAFGNVARLGLVEHKRDFGYQRTGNLYVEFSQRCSDGVWRRSGIATTEAEHWAFEFLPNHWLLVPTGRLLQIARRVYLEQPQRVVFGGDNNGTKGVLIPMAMLVKGK
jgi:hypothetical protein